MKSNGDSIHHVSIESRGKVSDITFGKKITARDIKGNYNVIGDGTVTIGGQLTPIDKEPTVDEFKQLLAEIQKELAEITAQKELLKEISLEAQFTAPGAEEGVKDVATKLEEIPEIKPEDAREMQEKLDGSTSLLTGILDKAETVVQKAGEVGNAVKPLAEKLGPLLEKISAAGIWVAKLWALSE